MNGSVAYNKPMVEIKNFYPVPTARPSEAPQQRPDGRQQQHDRLHQAHDTNDAAKRVSSAKAPLNMMPNEEALERLISRAQDAQTAGQTLDRGTILNLMV